MLHKRDYDCGWELQPSDKIRVKSNYHFIITGGGFYNHIPNTRRFFLCFQDCISVLLFSIIFAHGSFLYKNWMEGRSRLVCLLRLVYFVLSWGKEREIELILQMDSSFIAVI